MKKYTILAAAFAMLAFASCNKEENTINRDANGNYLVTFTSEKGQDKAGFDADFNGQLFDAEDSIIMNGAYRHYNLQTIENDPQCTELYSYCIQMAVPAADAENPLFFLYPGSQFNMDENGDAFVDMPSNPIPATSMNTSDLTLYYLEQGLNVPEDLYAWRTIDDRVVWPMAGYLPEGVITGHDQTVHFYMKNTTAFLTPNIKFGRAFLAAASQARLFDPSLYVNNNSPIPVLHIQTVTFTSDAQMAGMGHVEYVAGEPILMMDENAENGSQLLIDIYNEDYFDPINFGYNPYFTAATSTSGRGLGNIPVACGPQTLQMTVTFTLTFMNENQEEVVYNGVYNGEAVELNLARNIRYMCNVDMYNSGNASNGKVTLTLAE